MSTASLIHSYRRSESPDEKHDLLFQISDQADAAGLNFLVDLIISEESDEEDRIAAIEALKAHVGILGSTHAFMHILDWLETGKGVVVGVSQLVRFCGYANREWRDRIIRLLSSNAAALAQETMLVDIGIHGKSFFSDSDLSAITNPENIKYIEFSRREWARQK